MSSTRFSYTNIQVNSCQKKMMNIFKKQLPMWFIQKLSVGTECSFIKIDRTQLEIWFSRIHFLYPSYHSIQLIEYKFKVEYYDFLEPIGGSAPKFSSVAIEQILVKVSEPISLTCPAQGSPTPAFRYSQCISY